MHENCCVAIFACGPKHLCITRTYNSRNIQVASSCIKMCITQSWPAQVGSSHKFLSLLPLDAVKQAFPSSVAHLLIADPMISAAATNGGTSSSSSIIKSVLRRKKSWSWKQHIICSFLMSIKKGPKRRAAFRRRPQ
jgi:hypothetical protein